MAGGGWGHARPVEPDTGIYDVLLAFVTQGGQLYGARRWPDNPLTLTHVRWQGPGGGSLEALRRPDHDTATSQEERDVWVQLALHVPNAPSSGRPGEAAWLPLGVAPATASAWVSMLKQGRRRSQGSPPFDSSPRPPAWPAPDDAPTFRWEEADMGAPGPHASDAVTARDAVPPMPRIPTQPPFAVPQASPQPPSGSPYSQSDRTAGGWQRGTPEASEVYALPCVEVELPPMAGPGATYRQEFARDVALHFARAVRSVPYVREARGWMRGDRLMLAARFAVANGSRPPTSMEMERAAHYLADVLAQVTLPYARIGFADPGEWTQGAPLPLPGA